MTSRLFAENNREQIKEFAANGGVVIVPIGAIEQHGPHLPVWADTLQVEHITRSAMGLVSKETPIMVTPTMPFGSSDHHLPFGGTISLDTKVLLDVLMNIGRSLTKSGFRKIMFINGHGGNHEIFQLAARDLALQTNIHAAAASWWSVAWSRIKKTDAFDFGRVPGHAGAFESAIVKAIAPHLVGPKPPASLWPDKDSPTKRDSWIAPMRVELAGSWQKMNGYGDNPGAIPDDLGKELLQMSIEAVAEAIENFYAATVKADNG
ncbi:MAG: creatininase family protein [Rhodoluna sp.]